MTRSTPGTLTVIGAGNIGRALALGLTAHGLYAPDAVTLTRRQPDRLDDLAALGFHVTKDNVAAVRAADVVVVAVEPQQLDGVLDGIGSALDPQRHVLVSVVSGANIADIAKRLPVEVPVIRAMPNTAMALGRSMTCLASNVLGAAALPRIRELFDALGATLVVREEMMVPATALCACGIAYFLRMIRAASQGGIEIGFHPDDALKLAAQTALGAASLVLQEGSHPERQIDHVTTPRGCTITGLNEMEHAGLSSAIIRGIVTSADKAAGLYRLG
ncbi:MAG TPA: pyrroline-5-carboxylate reductase [Candidatus Krumholzibacteria bacterium]|nr:pyrroline-5-carboxylate reductase [Candidatus Krumholzibacteria bacterium]